MNTSNQTKVVDCVYLTQGLTVNEISNSTGLKGDVLTNIIDKLEKCGIFEAIIEDSTVIYRTVAAYKPKETTDKEKNSHEEYGINDVLAFFTQNPNAVFSRKDLVIKFKDLIVEHNVDAYLKALKSNKKINCFSRGKYQLNTDQIGTDEVEVPLMTAEELLKAHPAPAVNNIEHVGGARFGCFDDGAVVIESQNQILTLSKQDALRMFKFLKPMLGH